jgi:hypothetical protein
MNPENGASAAHAARADVAEFGLGSGDRARALQIVRACRRAGGRGPPLGGTGASRRRGRTGAVSSQHSVRRDLDRMRNRELCPTHAAALSPKVITGCDEEAAIASFRAHRRWTST